MQRANTERNLQRLLNKGIKESGKKWITIKMNGCSPPKKKNIQNVTYERNVKIKQVKNITIWKDLLKTMENMT